MKKNFHKKLPQKKLYSEYVRAMNGYFGLSPREAEVYSFIVKLDAQWKPLSDKDYKNILSTSNRRLIIRECNMRKTNVSRLVLVLKEKGLLIVNENGGYEVPPHLSLNSNSGKIEILFILEPISDDDGTGKNS
jgi:hypothetical protein